MAGYVAFWFVCMLLGLAIGSGKGAAGSGAVLGLLLGPLGLLIVVFMKPSIEVQAQRAEAVDVARARLREQQAAAPAAALPEPGPVLPAENDPWGDAPTRRR